MSTKRLAWQERKAESFTASPLHCGAAYLGFRDSADYGGKSKDGDPHKSGLSLGTAMAISGAAVSPNMGYHSSPSIALLLTLFNVRLGWWLPICSPNRRSTTKIRRRVAQGGRAREQPTRRSNSFTFVCSATEMPLCKAVVFVVGLDFADRPPVRFMPRRGPALWDLWRCALRP